MSTATLSDADVSDPRWRPPGRLRRSWDRHWYAYAMVLPVVLVLSLLVLYPLARGVVISLTDLTEANENAYIEQKVLGGDTEQVPNPDRWEFIGFDNYTRVLSGEEGSFYGQLRTTLIWTVSCVVLHYTIGLGLAVLLNRGLRGRGAYRVLLILPWAVPAFVAAFAWRFLYDRDAGLINAGLDAVGLPTVGWLDDPTLALVSVIAVNVWIGVPFMMVALLGGMQTIPAELYEAAEMDGASAWQRFRDVTLPGLRPVSMTVILLGTIWTFNMFPIIYLVTRGGPGDATEILVTGAFEEAFTGIRDYAMSATYGVLILSILLVFAAAYRRALRAHGEVW